MRGAAATLRGELIGLAGVVERNVYLVRRYVWWEIAFFIWTVANTLTIVFIAKGIEAAGGTIDVERTTTILLIGAVIWAYLGIIFEILTETVQWARWEGTIEYTFMAPLARPVHKAGLGIFALNLPGIQGGLIQMVNHGISAGALFVIASMILRRTGTTDIPSLGGLASRYPLITAFFLLAMFSSAG